MANQYDTNLKLQAIADAIGDSSSSGLISALEDIADAVAGGGGGGSSAAGLVSDNFSETDTYDLGDFCIHNNTLYVCINAITTPGPWDLSDWQATNSGIELSSLNSAIATKATIKYLAVSAGNTDANGFRLIGIKGDRIPLFMDTTATNQMVHFFHANGYWYIYLTNDQNVKLANTSVSGNLYYLDKNTATPET